MQYNQEKIPVKVFTFAIDSRGRDQNKYLNPNNYVVDIEHPFRNVIKVELVHALYETYGVEKYVNLCIDELQGNVLSNTDSVAGAFTQLPLLNHVNEYTHTHFRSIRIFEQPLQKLSRFTIRFADLDKELYDIKEHYLRFEIHCSMFLGSDIAKHMDVISEHVNVFTPVQSIQHHQSHRSHHLH